MGAEPLVSARHGTRPRLTCWCTRSAARGPLRLPARSTSRPPRSPTAPDALSSRTLALGSSHTCGRTGAGEVYCWGLNSFGQLGDGTEQPRATPTKVAGGIVFRSITAGAFQTCGATAGGEAYCWGKNSTVPIADAAATVREPTRVDQLTLATTN